MYNIDKEINKLIKAIKIHEHNEEYDMAKELNKILEVMVDVNLRKTERLIKELENEKNL